MAVGQVISNYEPDIAIEGTVNKGEKPENSLIMRQVEFIRKLGNIVIYRQNKAMFINAVIWLDKLLVVKGKDSKYKEMKSRLDKKYNIVGEQIDFLPEDKKVLYCIDLFTEQLAYINRGMEKDIYGMLEIDIDKVKLEEQKEMEKDGE